MDNLPNAIVAYVARFGGLLEEAISELSEDDYEELLKVAAATIAMHFADRIDQHWTEGR